MNMPVLGFLILSLFALSASALQFSVTELCEEKVFFQTELTPQNKTLGQLTVEILNLNKISFQGDASGIKSIAQSPVGDEALEVLSDFEMRAYGWCVAVDGKELDRMPDEVLITSATKEIKWFYAFAFYDRGEWKSFCTPAFRVKPSQICR